MAHPLVQFADLFGIALISSLILSILVIALAIRFLLLTDVSRPWKIAGMGFILSMVATMILATGLFRGRLNGNCFMAFFGCYLASGVLLYTSLRQLGRTSGGHSSVRLG